MQNFVVVLAVLGALAVAYRLLRSFARFLLAFAEVTAASGLAEVSARRGDLTLLAERQATERTARQRQWRDLLFMVLWLAWLVIPPFTGWTQPLYAAAVPLWFLPYRRVRFPPPAR